jgi:hypothetical protein
MFLLVRPLFAFQCRFTYANQNLAEGVGFEPTVGFPTLDFESSALNRTQPPFQSLDIVDLILGCAIVSRARLRGLKANASPLLPEELDKLNHLAAPTFTFGCGTN